MGVAELDTLAVQSFQRKTCTVISYSACPRNVSLWGEMKCLHSKITFLISSQIAMSCLPFFADQNQPPLHFPASFPPRLLSLTFLSLLPLAFLSVALLPLPLGSQLLRCSYPSRLGQRNRKWSIRELILRGFSGSSSSRSRGGSYR